MKAQTSATGAIPRGITYPSYKSLDDLIDLAKLISLDEELTSLIEQHANKPGADYFLNEHRLDAGAPHQPGAREIWLTRTKPGTPYNYLDLNKPGLWNKTREADDFGSLFRFIGTLPFKALGRVLIIYDYSGIEVPAHRDHLETSICHDFIWFRTNRRKRLYMYNQLTQEKLYVESYSAWFDTVNQFHGGDPSSGLTFSIRVDGIFNDQFRKQIPFCHHNPAATPALWAMQTDHN
ncbi:MAG TPA: hypothetical protein VJV03_12460 [Pyrinomonadaceae bacterium]|nr:hypothetical protein [Pyrinomonadaceae bacterium]